MKHPLYAGAWKKWYHINNGEVVLSQGFSGQCRQRHVRWVGCHSIDSKQIYIEKFHSIVNESVCIDMKWLAIEVYFTVVGNTMRSPRLRRCDLSSTCTIKALMTPVVK